MIKIAVSGACGKMGSLIIQNAAAAKDMKLVAAFDVVEICKTGSVKISSPKDMDAVLRKTKPDVLVDFTVADATVENIKAGVRNKVNLVVGTTGFSTEQSKEIKRVVGKNVAAVISPNFSVGVNIFWKLIELATPYLRDCDVEIIEAHHRMKKDAPSGTALHAARIVADIKKAKLIYGRQGVSPRGNEVCVHAIRGGDVFGEHTIFYAGDGERVEITHRLHSRQALASGALVAARWVVGAEKGVHSMKEVLGLS
jgi:4-hydroxy-tetrahydrodipicolinate reductase